MKKFKEYDKIFTVRELDRTRAIYMDEKYWPNGCETDYWSHRTSSWVQDFVQYCTYRASDHLDWQRFRVSMKGMTTPEKIQMLQTYLLLHVKDNPNETLQAIQQCRIDNYIGALRRGGQLNDRYEVVK